MNDFFFWNRWSNEFRKVYMLFLALFLISLLFYTVSYFIGIKAVINWEKNSVIEPISITIDQFTRNYFNFSVKVESYIIRQIFHASEVKVNLISSYIFVGFLAIALVLGVTISTFLSGISYYLGTAVLMIWIVTSNLELLSIFHHEDKIPTAIIIFLLGGLSFYFNFFKTNATFLFRFLSFATAVACITVLITLGVEVKSIALHFSNFAIVVPIVISILFIAINGLEIINVLLFISAGTSNKIESKSRIFNFIGISLLYLINALFVLLKKMLFIDWDILYLNAFLLYVLAAVLGIWGYKKRAYLFKEFISFKPFGGLFYLTLAVIANATIAYSFITGNDPLTECFEYAIVYSHVCFGTIYFLYILFNFTPLFQKKISIYEIVYRPVNLPFFMVRGLGGVAILAIFMYSKSFAFYLGMAGYFNLCGDFYKFENDTALAKQYYRSGMQSEFQNHRSNYSLATLAETENNKEEEFEYYKGTLVKYPMEYTYANLSNFYQREDLFFDAVFTLREGVNKFPESGNLANNLGILYSKTGLIDSTFFYLNEAKNNAIDKALPATNLLYFLFKKDLLPDADSIIKEKDFPDDISFQSNKMAVANSLKKIYKSNSLTVDIKKPLLPLSFSYLYNSGLNKIEDTVLVTERIKMLDSLIHIPENGSYHEALQLQKIINLYYSQQKKHAFVLLENLKNNSVHPAAFNELTAIWMMEQEAYKPASVEFEKTIATKGETGLLNYCMALAEIGPSKELLSNLSVLTNSKNKAIVYVAKTLQDILTNGSDIIKSFSEEKLLQYIHLNKNKLTEENLESAVALLKNNPYSSLAMAEIMSFYLNINNIEKASYYLGKAKSNDKNYKAGVLNLILLKYYDAVSDFNKLKSLSKSIYLNKDQENLRYYFNGRVAEAAGNLKEAEAFYLKGIEAAPYFEKGITGTVNFYNRIKSRDKGYDIIAEAIQFFPSSALLFQLYCMQALELNLISYAEEGLKSLSPLMEHDEYEIFYKAYKKKKQQMEQLYE